MHLEYNPDFVATLPYSGLIFCIALEHQKTADLLHSINELLCYLQGVTQTITCDNMRTAVTKADRYEPISLPPGPVNPETKQW
jgi:transposase